MILFARYRASGPPVAVQAACVGQMFEGDSFTVCPVDSSHQILTLALRNADGTPLRSFAALADRLGAQSQRVDFAMNAGMFGETGEPIGLYVENGIQQHALNRRDGPGNFHMKPNGVFWVDARGPHIDTTDTFAARTDARPVFATQSGPMLVANGTVNAQFAPDGASRYVRNGVGMTASGQPVFAISSAPVSFGKFARFFRDALHCRDALYFDGAVSSLWDQPSGRMDSGVAIGPMVLVSEPTAESGKSKPRTR